MFPAKPVWSAALSLQRDCLQASDARASSALVYFQLQFLCAQHHLECGHQRARSSRKHMAHEQETQRSSTPLFLSPAQNNIALSPYAHTNKHTHFFSSPKLRDADHRAGDTAGAVKSAQTHLRRRRRANPASAERLKTTSLTLGRRSSSAPGPSADVSLLFKSACRSWQVQLRIHCHPVRSVAAESGSVRAGPAQLDSVRHCRHRPREDGEARRGVDCLRFSISRRAERTQRLCSCLFIISCPCDTLRPLSMET